MMVSLPHMGFIMDALTDSVVFSTEDKAPTKRKRKAKSKMQKFQGQKKFAPGLIPVVKQWFIDNQERKWRREERLQHYQYKLKMAYQNDSTDFHVDFWLCALSLCER